MTCRHFGHCGGCAYQDIPDAEYRALKRQSVVAALACHGVDADVADIIEVPPGTRRRATMKAKRTLAGVVIGFHAARSHDIVDIAECLVLTPRLTSLLPGLRAMFAELLRPDEDAELRLTETESGIDLGLKWRKRDDTATLAALARWADKLNIARATANGEIVVSLGQPAVRLGKAVVSLPPEAFLQPTREGEAVLQDFVCEALARCKTVADLFCGCGTFSFPLAEHSRVHAVELEEPMLKALAAAAKATSGLKPIATEKRNLFKRPLSPAELNAFDGVCLDPPRAGALDQVKMLAQSKIARIAYVSCDADSFARDARLLCDAGFRLGGVVPVDQFLWSSHVELTGAFMR
jgi:23S rRNA (uracil1939-C5)-methyltransferase